MAIALYPSLVEQLYHVEGKAEIVDGKIVPLMPTGRLPIFATLRLAMSLYLHVLAAKLPGIAVPDGAGFIVHLPNRQSFSPDAAYYEGPNSGMKFFEGAPLFAVEIRSENDYGFAAEREMEHKRRDYFDAGTLVVWDVDLQSDDVVRKYTSTSGADVPLTIYHRGDAAEAESAVPGWTIMVDDLFES